MSATNATTGKATKLGHSDTSGGVYSYLAEVVECSQPELVIGNVEATHYESPNNFVEKKSVIWRDVSDLTVTLNYTKSQTATLYSLAGAEKFWEIVKPDGSNYRFGGFISRLGGGPIPNKDIIRQPVSITVTTNITFTPASS